MTEVLLEFGPVTASGTAAFVVGSPPQWADDSDSTYGELPTVTGTNLSDSLSATLEPYTGPIGSAMLFIRTDNDRLVGSLIIAEFTSDGGNIFTEGQFGGMFTAAFGVTNRLQPLNLLSGTANLSEVLAHPTTMTIKWASAAEDTRVRVLKARLVITLPNVLTGGGWSVGEEG